MAVAITPLGYALLGLVRADPRSGYGLRRVFETTPMGNYSSSPGSIYPALKSLQRDGLVEARPAVKGHVFHLTPAGGAAFETWLRQPVTADDVARRMSEIMLRFAFLHDHPDRQLTLDLLVSLENAARAQASGLETWLSGDAGRIMPLQAQLAVRQGMMSVQSVAEWAAYANRQLTDDFEAKLKKGVQS